MKRSKRKKRLSTRHRRYRTQPRSRNFLPKILLLVGVILVIIFFFGDHGIYRLYELKREKQALLEEIDRLREERRTLLTEKQKLESDLEYIEQLAREEHRMARPKEKVFKVVTPPEE